MSRPLASKALKAAKYAAQYGSFPKAPDPRPKEYLLHVQRVKDGYDKPDPALATVHSEWGSYEFARRAAAMQLRPYDWFWVTDLTGRVLLHTYPNALCARCHRDVEDDYYMVTDEVWQAVMADEPEGQLCLRCLDNEVVDWRGYPLRREDFKEIGLNSDCPRAERIMRLYGPDNTLAPA